MDVLKENSIRKETQLEQIDSYIKVELERIEMILVLSKEIITETINSSDFSHINIKNEEINLKNLRNKIDNFDDINLTAEKELKELENKINDILIEEKDLNNAAKKLEKAIEELNKEARNRIINTFTNINNTFSELFKKLFDGGKAYLELTDSEDPLEAGSRINGFSSWKKTSKNFIAIRRRKGFGILSFNFFYFYK